ncbi:MAG: type III-A CRISPR-associated protein Csm2 [Sutterellaceae bacterium]|nr:type III-A CRISPR-associated protein Csm2 [Burkholderiaceae bacterium]MDW8430203.1 type III-A CRISPR-associated protein Csm2 [Sutterellaceae bacterium]
MQRNTSSRPGGPPPHQGRGDRPQWRRDDRETAPAIDVAPIRFGGEIDPHLYSDVAEGAAKTVGANQKQKNKPSQLRRFYDELVMLQEKVGADKDRFEQQKPFIQMLKAKVAYAKGRDKVDENFEKLLRKVVDEVTDPETLKQAKLFMEAFMAFYKVYGPKD